MEHVQFVEVKRELDTTDEEESTAAAFNTAAIEWKESVMVQVKHEGCFLGDVSRDTVPQNRIHAVNEPCIQAIKVEKFESSKPCESSNEDYTVETPEKCYLEPDIKLEIEDREEADDRLDLPKPIKSHLVTDVEVVGDISPLKVQETEDEHFYSNRQQVGNRAHAVARDTPKNQSRKRTSDSANTSQSSEQAYVCELCKKSYKYFRHLRRHMTTHSDERPFVCDHCGKGFNRNSTLKVHLCTHATDSPFACSHCSMSFIYKSHLTRHSHTHTGERPFNCEYCGRTFVRGTHLAQHLRTHSGERPYTCDNCAMSFISRSRLTSHILTHGEERPHACDFCGKTFRQKAHLTAHMYTHTGERPYSCDFCVKKFSRRSNLNIHLRTHSHDCPYNCDDCGKSFSDKSNFNKHRKTHIKQ